MFGFEVEVKLLILTDTHKYIALEKYVSTMNDIYLYKCIQKYEKNRMKNVSGK